MTFFYSGFAAALVAVAVVLFLLWQLAKYASKRFTAWFYSHGYEWQDEFKERVKLTFYGFLMGAAVALLFCLVGGFRH